MSSKDESRSKRVGVIEIGSRAVRYLVADFDQSGSYRSQYAPRPFMHGVELENMNEAKIAEMLLAVNAFNEDLEMRRCDRTMVYGTELCRRLATGTCHQLPPFLHVLSPEQEAFGAWAAGFISRQTETARYTVVDQGGGSAELISADWTGETFNHAVVLSLEAGNQRLAKLFVSSGYGHGFSTAVQDLLQKSVADLRLHESKNESNEIIFLGSAATKLAFNIKHKRDEKDDYSSRLVNGTRLTIREISYYYNKISKIHRVDPGRARDLIDRRVDEYDLVMSSSVLLMLISIRLGHHKITVSANGTRHGMGFLVCRGLI